MIVIRWKNEGTCINYIHQYLPSEDFFDNYILKIEHKHNKLPHLQEILSFKLPLSHFGEFESLIKHSNFIYPLNMPLEPKIYQIYNKKHFKIHNLIF